MNKTKQNFTFLETLFDSENFNKGLEIALKAKEFSKKLKLPKIQKIPFAKTQSDFLNSFLIRKKVYSLLDYGKEFSSVNNYLEFDDFDPNSITFLYKRKNQILASSRLIFDSSDGLQSDRYVNLTPYRRNGKLVETSRTVILPEFQRRLYIQPHIAKMIFRLAKDNGINSVICAVINSHTKMYDFLGGITKIKEDIKTNLDERITILHWDLEKANKRFIQRCYSN